MESVGEQGVRDPSTYVDSRWFDAGQFDTPRVRQAKEQCDLHALIRESIRTPATEAAMVGQYLAAVEHALAHDVTRLVLSEQFIPATGNDIGIHKEALDSIEWSGRNSAIFFSNPDRASRHVPYGKKLWKRAKSLHAPIHTPETSYKFNANGRKLWERHISDAQTNNDLRAEGNRQSHGSSRMRGQHRSRPPKGLARGADGLLTPLPSWGEALNDIFTTALNQGDIRALLSRLRRDGAWRRAHGHASESTQLAIARDIIRNPMYAGLRRWPGEQDSQLHSFASHRSIEPEEYYQLVLLHQTLEQRRLRNEGNYWVAGKIVDEGCGKPFLSASSFFTIEGEIVSDRKAYVCPPRCGCAVRKVINVDDIHSQLPGLWEAIAGKKPYLPENLSELWEMTPDDERKAFVQKYVKRRLNVVTGTIQPPSWA